VAGSGARAALAATALVAGAAAVETFRPQPVAVAGYAGVALVLSLLAGTRTVGQATPVLTVLAGVCAARIVVIATPLPSTDPVIRIAVGGAGLWLVLALLLWADGSLGLRGVSPAVPARQLGVVASGVAVGVLAYLVGGDVVIEPRTPLDAILALAVVAFLAAAPEELLFRGLLAGVTGRFGRCAPVLDGLAYAAWYLPSRDLGTVALAAVVGAAAGQVRRRTGRVDALVAAHIGATVVATLVLPAAVG
jgi:membrane protease YdiL (CAAX protease family)